MARRNVNVVDEFVAVEELHGLSAHDINKLLQDADSFVLNLTSAKGVSLQVDMEQLANCLPLHVIACVASSGAEPRLRYWLRAVRLLHSLSTVASRYPKLEQVFFQEVKIRMQILDLITYMLVVLANMEQEGRGGSFMAVLHAALVACSLYLLISFISHDWADVAPVLLAHPKVNVFMDAAFDAVKRDIILLQVKLRSLQNKIGAKKTTVLAAERVGLVTAQQCEASLQVLQFLCIPQAFRDKVLAHKELCREGGILRLVLAVLRLQLPPAFLLSRPLQATVSRSRAKVLIMMLKFCESVQFSFLDEVAADARSMQLAEQVAAEVLALVRGALLDDPRPIDDEDEERRNPMGLLHVTAMRLADIFSDDSNFRNLVMDQIAPDLATVLAVLPTKFHERWCGGPIARELASGEMDAILVYNPFEAAGEAMAASAKAAIVGTSGQEEVSSVPEFNVVPPVASASQIRAALLVKLFANLFCYNPEVCAAEEKDRFLRTFLNCLHKGPLQPNHALFFHSVERTAVRICENLRTLHDYVLTITSEIINDDDLALVSAFAEELHRNICPTLTSVMEAPLVSFVRDGHEQKLELWKQDRQKLQRWQRIQQIGLAASPLTLPAVKVEESAGIEELPKLENVPRAEVAAFGGLGTTEIAGDVMKAEAGTGAVVDAKLQLELRTRPEVEREMEVVSDGNGDRDLQEDPNQEVFAQQVDAGKWEMRNTELTEERGSESVNATTEREEGGKGEQESWGMTVSGTPTPTPRRGSRERERHSSEHESQPKKRKRNIMNDAQVRIMENALLSEPEMQRSPRSIQHWTDHLNRMGPEVLYQQLKNWLNNRKSRIAREERDKQRAAEGEFLNARTDNKSRHTRSAPTDSPVGSSPFEAPGGAKGDHGDLQEFAAMKRALQGHSSPALLQTGNKVFGRQGTTQGEPENHGSMFGKWKLGDNVRLCDMDGKEMAVGTVHQVEGHWQGSNLEEHNSCLVQVSDLKVDKTTKLPFPFTLAGTSFEEAETLMGKPRVPWDVDHMYLIPSEISK
ncbi:hypothetical protein BDL97_04G139900 [Sphagnum fallax]|nr:hypothetical protein BDL97_04G139900 [Sphagnum fallax]